MKNDNKGSLAETIKSIPRIVIRRPFPVRAATYNIYSTRPATHYDPADYVGIGVTGHAFRRENWVDDTIIFFQESYKTVRDLMFDLKEKYSRKIIF